MVANRALLLRKTSTAFEQPYPVSLLGVVPVPFQAYPQRALLAPLEQRS